MNEYAIAFDVGGHFIKSAVINRSGEMSKDTMMFYPSHAHMKKDQWLDYLTGVIQMQAAKIMDKQFRLQGIGFAFPGPFDYEQGIPYIRGLQKFESIYGVNLKLELMRRLKKQSFLELRMTDDFIIAFENDANLFAYGELLQGKAKEYKRSICMTIGTGAGSAFIDDGQLIKNRSDVPANGWIYADPFKDSIVDEYISKRGIMRLAEEHQVDAYQDVRELAEAARSGSLPSSIVFARFGEHLGEMLGPYLRKFRPEAVIIGGQIVKSADLFQQGLFASLNFPKDRIHFVDQISISTFTGVSQLLAVERTAQKLRRNEHL